MQILVTGAAGSIGQVVTPGLTALGHTVIGLDRLPPPGGYDAPWHVADCADADAVRDALSAQAIDAVLHLAGHPDEANLPDSLTSHVITTAALLDAMVAQGIERIVYASSNHAVGRTPRSELLTTTVAPRPDTHYGVGKVAAEALLQLFADRHDIQAVSCRIGSFLPETLTTRHLSTWLSHGDCVRMFHAALTAPAPGFAVVYGVSANSRGWWDLQPGKEIGYLPLDDAERFADSIPSRPADESEGAVVGGPFAGSEFVRPALG